MSAGLAFLQDSGLLQTRTNRQDKLNYHTDPQEAQHSLTTDGKVCEAFQHVSNTVTKAQASIPAIDLLQTQAEPQGDAGS